MLGCLVVVSKAQRLNWQISDSARGSAYIYGEITALVAGPDTYFCGADWTSSTYGRGYAGMQEADGGVHRVVFSVWDRAGCPVQIGPIRAKEFVGRFQGKGTGVHTHLAYDWQKGKVFRFLIVRRRRAGNQTHTEFRFFNEAESRWQIEASTFQSLPSKPSGRSEDQLASFISNWNSGQSEKPKLALFRLWMGSSLRHLSPLTKARGSGDWGMISDAFYLASGSASATLHLKNALLARGLKVGVGGQTLSLHGVGRADMRISLNL